MDVEFQLTSRFRRIVEIVLLPSSPGHANTPHFRWALTFGVGLQ